MTDKVVETMQERIAEYSHYSNQSKENYNEPNSTLGSPKPAASFYDDFKPSYLTRPNLNNDMPLSSLEHESNLPMSLSPHFALHTSSQREVTEEVQAFPIPPAPFTQFYDFEEGEEFENASELRMSITSMIQMS